MDGKKYKKKETKKLSLTLSKNVVERIQYLRKVANIKNLDAYKSLNNEIYNWLVEQEKMLKIKPNDHKKNVICPECGSKLLVKEGKNGKFIGCSNYPSCKHTSSL
jgi:DNA topoisomerase-1